MKIRLVAGLLFMMSVASAQQMADNVYWVYFTDKNGNGYEIDHPEAFLSQRSVNRRAWQELAIDRRDLPVTQAYVEELEVMGVEVKHISRWLNGIAMINADQQLFEQVLAKPFVDTVAWEPDMNDLYFPPAPNGNRFEPPLITPPGYDYGVATEQILMMDMDFLHDKGYTGKGVWIAVLDAGFRNVDSLPSFEAMINEGRLLGTRNFVNDIPIFRQNSIHGMYVLSTMGAEWNGNMIGTAPHASYFLCMTENPDQETRIEEVAWIEAAEYIDSLGFDVINTSLGYSDFDSTDFDYTYRDMDGKTTYISRAASLTAAKGIIACNSAGNSGDKSWFYITAPADADNTLAVGAVDSTNVIGNFSSRGPSFDARIKPDVVAMGVATCLQSVYGGLARGGGTSFASPLVAGSVASLWQAYPETPAKELIHMIRQSGDSNKNPDSTYGFGLPSFAKVYWSITGVPAQFIPGQMEIYPNPARQHIMIRLPEENMTGSYDLRFLDMSGRILHSQQVSIPGEVYLPDVLMSGLYIVEVKTPRGVYHSRLIKE
ncbi:MAG: S8 family serine peptidase [Bacteroidales bacterium]|nr:S8 family serine peptidase [Bacteroidales bacterium]